MRNDGKKPGGVTGKGWQPGVSGNPKGLTKGRISFKRILEEKLSEVWERDYRKRTALEMIADQLIYQAIVKKSRHAVSEILDRYDGKPVQAVALADLRPESREQLIESILETARAMKEDENRTIQ